MKKIITLALIAAIITANTSVFAAPVPRECAPYGTDEAAIMITENLISPILDSVANGEGYGSASANTAIRKAVILNQTNGYGYALLSAISQNARNGGENQAYHLIQSFKQGEVTPEQCHEIGKKFVDEVLGGKYEYVIATHTNCGHYHNHIIFNAVSFKDYKRYKSDKKSYFRIREISDKICAEYGLNIIEPNKNNRNYEHKKTYISNKYRIKKAIDECILYAADYEDFIRQMQSRNYIVRQDEWLWFRDSSNKRFTKTDTIGKAYSRDNIERRIKGIYHPTTVDLLIDIENNIKCQQSKGYEHWAKIHNLKLAAKTLNILQECGLLNYDNLSKRVSEKSDKLKSIQDKIKSDKQRINELDTIMKNMNTYRKLKPIYEEYSNKNSLMKNGFYNKHKQEIDLFQRVANKMKQYKNKSDKLPSVKQLEAEQQKLQTDITKLSEQFIAIKSERDELAVLKQNVDMFLKKTSKLQQETQPKKKPSILKKLAEYQDSAKQQNEQHKHHRDNNPEL